MQISDLAIFAGSLCFIGTMLWAGLMDIRTLTIRNELALFLIASYAALAPLTGINLDTLMFDSAVATVVLAACFILFFFGWIGGGDAKLASVAALWVGSDHVLNFLLYTALFGGALTMAVLQFRSVQLPAHLLRREWIVRLHQSRSGVPYGVAIAAGALAVLPSSRWLAYPLQG